MKHFILCLFLLISFYASAQQQENPCNSPKLELYGAQNELLPEGTMPRGTVKLVVKNNPKCTREITFEVVRAKVYYVRGTRPLAYVEVNGQNVDFTDWEGAYKPGDRILFEILDVNYTFSDGKKGRFPGAVMENWVFKE